ncbi:MAG: energy transducer TonB [Deltaproteobacteria bacterium]|nr:energy transducer TonB [Kofleriaceae bacterium]
MFENFEEFRNRRMPGWVIPVLIAAIVAHVAVFAIVVFNEMWAAPLLDVPSSGVDLAVAPPPPPPPPPPAGGKKLEAQKEKKPKKVKPTETVQPTKVEDKPEDQQEDSGDAAGEEGGEEGGVEGGVAGGVVGGVLTEAPPPPPPPPPPQPPKTVVPTALEAQRVSGDKNIFPDDVTKTEIQRSGKTQLIVPVKVCIDRAGNMASVRIMKSSGFPAYDQKLTREINKWRYRPFMVDGTPTPVCSVVQFVYRQK